jgi:tryptophan synthase beta chain
MSAPSVLGPKAQQFPDALGRFGAFGGRFVPETLMDALNRLADEYARAIADPAFQAELEGHLAHYVGRPSPLFHAERLTRLAGGADIYLKREDLNHTGAHKINNAIGQVMLARRMGKTRVIAETGRASMAWPPRRPARSSAWNAPSTWARRTSAARSSTSST